MCSKSGASSCLAAPRGNSRRREATRGDARQLARGAARQLESTAPRGNSRRRTRRRQLEATRGNSRRREATRGDASCSAAPRRRWVRPQVLSSSLPLPWHVGRDRQSESNVGRSFRGPGVADGARCLRRRRRCRIALISGGRFRRRCYLSIVCGRATITYGSR